MSEHTTSNGTGPASLPFGEKFSGDKTDGRSIPTGPLLAAGAVVLLILATLLFFGRGHGQKVINQVLPLDPYASSLVLSKLQMSESTSLSGGKSTYIDGHIANSGSHTVTGVTVQVLFRNDVGFAPQPTSPPNSPLRYHEAWRVGTHTARYSAWPDWDWIGGGFE